MSVHEIKSDGYRNQVIKNEDGIRLITKHGYDWTGRYTIAAAMRPQDALLAKANLTGPRLLPRAWAKLSQPMRCVRNISAIAKFGRWIVSPSTVLWATPPSAGGLAGRRSLAGHSRYAANSALGLTLFRDVSL